MKTEIKKLDDFRKWFNEYIKKEYGRKCKEFVWGCAACHAHFVKDVLVDFIQEEHDVEEWGRRQERKSRSGITRIIHKAKN